MYFSLITPAPGHERDAAHDWAQGAYEAHQWLWRFMLAPPGTARQFLFRRRDVDGLPRFYVVSAREPVAPAAHWQVHTKPYAPELTEGDRLAFDLRANPVVTTRNAAGKAARHDVVMQAKTQLLKQRGLSRWAEWVTPDRPPLPELVERSCRDWLLKRADALGATLDAESLRVEGYERHRGKAGELRFSTVDFSGQLQVRDAAALQQALFVGVGHAKAFGCGLLLVRPLGLTPMPRSEVS